MKKIFKIVAFATMLAAALAIAGCSNSSSSDSGGGSGDAAAIFGTDVWKASGMRNYYFIYAGRFYGVSASGENYTKSNMISELNDFTFHANGRITGNYFNDGRWTRSGDTIVCTGTFAIDGLGGPFAKDTSGKPNREDILRANGVNP